jgi:hypothetical protein
MGTMIDFDGAHVCGRHHPFQGDAMRERLHNRRRSETVDFEIAVGTAVLKYTATVGFYADGRVGELFLNNHKSNSTADTNARDAAIALSFALQHGANLEEIHKALCRESDGRASGPLGAALDLLKNNE